MRATVADGWMDADSEAIYWRIRRVAILVDGAFRLPGTKFRFGLNSLIGLPPWGGDAVLAMISLWIVWQASKLHIPRTTLIRMLGNVAVEAAFGAVPILGDLADIAWKANLRNLKIVEDHLSRAGYA